VSRRAAAALAGLAAIVALAAGCGIPTDSSPRPLQDVPFGLVVPPTTVSADEPTPSGSTYAAKLYFVSATRLVGVDVDLPLAATPQDQARVGWCSRPSPADRARTSRCGPRCGPAPR
jgi:hypothetical protein